jgi:hypothetical protein
MTQTICAIHQANFFPWIGYFDKIRRADTFVILDDVQYQKTGGSWSNRVALKINAKSQFFSAPITRPSGVRNINEVTFAQSNWRVKLLKTLQSNYAKASFYKEYKDFVFDLIENPEENIAAYNTHAIRELCALYTLETPIELSSNFGFGTKSNQLLIDLTKASKANCYMAGSGAGDYQDIDLFSQQGVDFMHQNFVHPVYGQSRTANFVPGLSILDYLFNVGARAW